MRLTTIFQRHRASFTHWTTAGLVFSMLLAGVIGVARADEDSPVIISVPVAGERTEISGIPWDPASLQQDEKIIYGEDDRLDVYQETDPLRLQWAASTCALVDEFQLTLNPNGTYSLMTFAWSYGGINACPSEPFGNQPVAAFCSGFMVGPDLIATAGHCIESELDLANTRFVFGFGMQDATTPVTIFPADQIYTGVEIVGREPSGLRDFALIRVDRPITAQGAVPFEIRRDGVVPIGQNIGVIGHPYGLPMKIAFGDNTEVKDNTPQTYFTANLDAAGGNSGSPVINTETGLVEGILVRGPAVDIVLEGTCFVSTRLPDDNAYLYVSSTKSTVWEEYVTDLGFRQGQYNLRATPTRDLLGRPVIPLTWAAPEGEDFLRAVLLRGIGDYPVDDSEGIEIYRGKDAKFLDQNLQEGIEYYYSLLVYKRNPATLAETTEIDYARAVAGAAPAEVLTEGFGVDPTTGQNRPIDISFSQILFSPVGPPRAGIGERAPAGVYSDYVASYKPGVDELPIKRQDAEGQAYEVIMGEDGIIFANSDRLAVPFFGRPITRWYLSANGYLSPDNIPWSTALNFPGVQSHYAVPRISFLFADLAPSVGGLIWYRPLRDRLVFTFEGMPEHPYPIAVEKAAGSNTVQVELFQSGHIRITYLELDVKSAIVGLSDGKGIPLDPASLFEGVDSVIRMTDFRSLPEQASKLTMDPLTTASRVPLLDAGSLAQFMARALVPPGIVGTPILTATWNREGLPPFADNNNSTGAFSWRTGLQDDGIYTVRVRAFLGDQQAYQDVRLIVGPVIVKPEAANLTISSDTPYEDPRRSRLVDVERPLIADYQYFHPWMLERPDMYGEGPSLLYWFRNGQVAPAYTNQRRIPPMATRGGDQWYFRLIPITASYVEGNTYFSPIITINAAPVITRVTPRFGLVLGDDTVLIQGARLNNVTSVKFGGVEARSFRVRSSTEIEVNTPLHPPATVDVTVGAGPFTGRIANAFTFINNASELFREDINKDGRVDALDIQLVKNYILGRADGKTQIYPDVNEDGVVNAADIQLVVNKALYR